MISVTTIGLSRSTVPLYLAALQWEQMEERVCLLLTDPHEIDKKIRMI